MTVTIASGEITAATALITLPVGVLQAGGVSFQPELPEGKSEAIEGLIMGPTIKAFAEFKRPWWEDSLGNVAGFRNADSVFHGWEALFWDRPGPAVLSAMIGMRGAELSGDKDAVKAAFLSDLADMFPDVEIEAEIVSLEVWDWTADPYAGGSLSVAQVGGQALREAPGVVEQGLALTLDALEQIDLDPADLGDGRQPRALGLPDEGVGRAQVERTAGGGGQTFERVGDAPQQRGEVRLGHDRVSESIRFEARDRRRGGTAGQSASMAPIAARLRGCCLASIRIAPPRGLALWSGGLGDRGEPGGCGGPLAPYMSTTRDGCLAASLGE